MRFFATLIILCFAALPVHAYVGPGAGLGLVGAIIGIMAALFFAVVAVFWYPVKRMLRKKDEDMTNNMADEENEKEAS